MPAIEIRDLHYTYPDGTAALAGVSLTLEPGEKVGIVGPNGAGKSTLLLQLNGLLTPQAGEVRIFGTPVVRANLKEVRRRVGIVFQNPDDQLFCPTVLEDVAFGPRAMGLPAAEVQARVDEALAAVNLASLGERSAHHLSFGQRKRIATATVISMRPDIWVFDEPSANLDPKTQLMLARFIGGLRQTVVVVTQDLYFAAETCDRLVVLAEGRVKLDGPTGEILGQPARLEEYDLEFGRQCRICEKSKEFSR
ncbi:MAG: ABC transporter ATP-binding protein [Myxococcales bacterium]|nr:ABC transporter ATP-binding protein [Myxococcales bacterium]